MTGVDLRVVCPSCRSGLLALPAPAVGEAACGQCRARFPLADGVLDLLAGRPERRSLAQMMMEWDPLVRIYESRLWRRSPLFTALMGISFESEYALIAANVQLTSDAEVLDLACGPGIYARRFARTARGGLIVGLDLSRPMLRYAARRAAAEGLPNLHFIRGTALALPFEVDRFDIVNCCGALHLFPDVSRAVGEVARVLRPGGRFAAAVFRRREGRLAAWATRVRRLRFGVDAFRPADLGAQLAGAGLTNIQCHHAAGIWLIMSAVKPFDHVRAA
jgi:SAM-dependent methyltransferase